MVRMGAAHTGRRASRVAFLVGNEGVDEEQVAAPWEAVVNVGAEPLLVAPKPGGVQLMRHFDRARVQPVDRPACATCAEDFDVLVLPGGVVGCDQLRIDPVSLRLILAMYLSGKPCAVIGHGAWPLIDAGVVNRRRMTSWPTIKSDIRNAGGDWVDSDLASCAKGPNLVISSRFADDLPAFCAALARICTGGSGVSGRTEPSTGSFVSPESSAFGRR